MSISNTIEDFKNIWNDLIGITPQLYKEKLVNRLVKDLSSIKNGIGVSALTVFDIEKNSFLFVDDDIERVTGISKTDYFNKGTSYIISKAKLEHVPLIIHSTIKQKLFFKGKPQAYYDNFIINREFAYKSKNEPVNWVLHQVVKHLFNDSGKLFAVIVLQTKFKSSNYIGKFRFYIYDKKQNAIIYPESSTKSKIDLLTSREKEIIVLLLQNKNNKEIAEMLHISYHTVRTHRKVAMKKLNCHSIYELAAQYNAFLE